MPGSMFRSTVNTTTTSFNYRIHNVTVSMTHIDLIKKPRTGRFGVDDHFLNSSIRRFQAVHCVPVYISVSFTFGIV